MEKPLHEENVIQLSKAKRKYIAWADEETGEITGFSHPVIKSKSDLGKGWVAMYQQAMEWLAEQKLPQEQYRVLLHLMAKLDFENYLRVTQKEIAEKLDMHQPSVAKAIKGLLEKDIIRNGRKLAMLELTVLTHAWLTRAVILKPLSLLLMDSIKPNLLYK